MSEFLAYAVGAGGYLALTMLFIYIEIKKKVWVAEPVKVIRWFEIFMCFTGLAFLVWKAVEWIRGKR